MVVFTCNHCGESVKKPAVAKHYLTKCRNRSKFVSCMDCQKDFREEEFNSHTSCITEAEKYSGKDYVPKPSFNAGLKKQESWLEIVRSILNSKDVDAKSEVRRIFQRLQTYDNVPRKKDKFIKFLWNSLRVHPGQAAPVWQVVEVALEKFKIARQQTASSKSKSKHEEQPDKVAETEAVEDLANTAAENGTNGEVQNKENGITKKSKKKKKRSGEPIMEDAPPMKHRNQEPSAGEASPKKEHNDDLMGDEAPSKEKLGEEQTPEEYPPKKKKKSKHADQITNVNAVVTNPEKNQLVNSEANVKTNNGIKFDWTQEIFSLVEKNDKQISLDDLKKNIFKKYRKTYNTDEIEWKVEKTFNKKLRKSGLIVEDNIVKMTS